MISSPLHLDSYFFTRIRVDACPKGCEKPGEGLLSTKVECRKHKEQPRKWLVELGVRKAEDKEKGCPEYTFQIEIVGLFEVDETFPLEKVEGIVRANGPAVLFGAVREMVANLTARGPFPAVKLETVSFVDLALPPPKKQRLAKASTAAPVAAPP